MKWGKYLKSSNDPVTKQVYRNIILPILEFRYAAEDRDVKDIIFEAEDPENQHLSLLIKKYWDDIFTVENDLDTFIDDALEEKIDFGGCLVKKGAGAVPEVIPLQSIAFCDQTDILGGPIGFKFNFSPEAIKRKGKLGWGKKENGATHTIDELIFLATKDKDSGDIKSSVGSQGTGKNIEVYVVRGSLPENYYDDKKGDDLMEQVQVVAFYFDDKGRHGVTLYKAPEKESVLKLHIPKKIYQRGLGWGGVEALIDPQMWTNFSEVHKNNLLKAASKIAYFTDDDNFHNRNKINDLENGEITTIDRESRYGIRQIPNGSPNIALFNTRVQDLEAHANALSGVSDALMGKSPAAGTPFRLQERVVFEGKKPHERTASKFDKFLEGIIQDWVIPHAISEITKGKEFLSELTSAEFAEVMKCVPKNRAVKRRNEDVLEARDLQDRYYGMNNDQILAAYEEEERQKLQAQGNKQVIKILKEEFKGVKMKVKIRVSSKQKDMAQFVDKLVNILKQYWTLPPEIKADPTTQHIMSQIIEASGLSASSLGGFSYQGSQGQQGTQTPQGGGEQMQMPQAEPPLALPARM